MKKFVVETYYTCTFKTVHKLNDLNEKELSKIDGRNDGDVEVIDVKLNNRKTRKLGETKAAKTTKDKIVNPIPKELSDKDNINNKKYNWQKDHQENQTGTQNSHKPIKITKEKINKRYETWK